MDTFRGRLSEADDIKRFVLAGNATLTLVSKKTGARFTYRFQKPDEEAPKVVFVKVLCGPDNTSHYKFIGVIWTTVLSRFRYSLKSKISSSAPSVVAVSWFLKQLFDEDYPTAPVLLQQLEVWHEGRCGRCGRKLTVPSSVSSGFGPDCVQQMAYKASAAIPCTHELRRS